MGYMDTATRTMVGGCGEGCVCSLAVRGPASWRRWQTGGGGPLQCGAVRAQRVRGGQTARGAASRACGAIEAWWSAVQAAGPRLENLGVVSSSRRDDWEGSRKHKAQACMSALIGARPGRCEAPHTAARHTLALGGPARSPLHAAQGSLCSSRPPAAHSSPFHPAASATQQLALRERRGECPVAPAI
ncbi:hypothetical protein PSPO01_02057 [Paraphaeosphaeria sporulosa]